MMYLRELCGKRIVGLLTPLFVCIYQLFIYKLKTNYMSKEIRQMIDKVKKFNHFINENTSIDNKLNKINSRIKKRSLKFVYGKEQMIDDIKEVVNAIGGKS